MIKKSEEYIKWKSWDKKQQKTKKCGIIKVMMLCSISYQMKNHNTFLYKNITVSSLLLEKSEISCKYERETNMKHLNTDWQRTAIVTLSLTHIVILYWGPNAFASLMEVLNWGPAGVHRPLSRHLLAVFWLTETLLSDQQTILSVVSCVYIIP